MGSSPTRGSSFFLGKVTALGVLCCFALFVCLILLASFFLPSHLSFKNMYMYNCLLVCMYMQYICLLFLDNTMEYHSLFVHFIAGGDFLAASSIATHTNDASIVYTLVGSY